jgi:hypothetical protein
MVYSFKGVDMSQGGMFSPDPAVVTYGSDGKAYGSPGAARAAGVYQEPVQLGGPAESYDQPVPMPGISAGGKGGGEPYSQRPMPPDFMPMPGNDLTPMPGISAGGKGGGDPYSQIMGQNGGGDPYSQIMGQMPTLQNPYATSTNEPFGGYDPRLYNNAFMGSNSRLNLSGLIGGGGGGDATTNPFSDLTQAERAAYYSQNPNMGTITQLGQKALGFTSLGALAKAMNPGLWSEEGLIAMGINPAAYQAAKEGFRATEISEMNAAAEAAANAAAESYGGGSFAEQQAMNDAIGQSISDQNTAGDGGGYGGYSDGGGSSSFGEGQYNMGGPVNRVGGPNPPGPDDGAGMLQLGEYVIKKSAVKKYGQGLLNMINDGKIPAKKMKSLLG